MAATETGFPALRGVVGVRVLDVKRLDRTEAEEEEEEAVGRGDAGKEVYARRQRHIETNGQTFIYMTASYDCYKWLLHGQQHCVSCMYIIYLFIYYRFIDI